MDDKSRRAYYTIIAGELRRAQRSLQTIGTIVSAGFKPGTSIEEKSRWEYQFVELISDALTQFFGACAMISKVLDPYPSRDSDDRNLTIARAVRRGEELRELLGVTRSWKLLNRDLRDSIEHYDERIDERLESGQDVDYLWEVRRTGNAETPFSFDRGMRAFDPVTKRFRVGGDEGNLEDLVNEMNDLGKKVRTHQRVLVVADGNDGPNQTITTSIHSSDT